MLEVAREVGTPRPGQAPRILNPLLQLVVADRAQGLVEHLGSLPLFGTGIGRHLIDLPLEVGHLLEHRVLAFDELAHALRRDPIRTGDIHRFFRDLQLLFDQRFAPLQCVLGVTLDPSGLVALQQSARSPQSIERGTRIRSRFVPSRRSRFPHRVGGVLKLARSLHQPLVRLHARELLQAARLLLDLVRERALILGTPTGRSLGAVGQALLALGLLLLTPCQLAQALQSLVDLFVRLLHFPTLHALVLVLELVQLQFEEVGQVFGTGAATTATAATLLLTHLDLVVERLGPQQVLERLLFLGERTSRIGGVQPLHGGLHLLAGPRQQGGDLIELGIPRDTPVVEARDQGRDLLAKSLLREPNHDQPLVEAFRRIALAVPVQIEGRRDDLPLLFRQLLFAAAAATTATTASLLLSLAEVGPETTDLNEVNIADGFLITRSGVVASLGVVGDDVPGHQLVFLEEKRVSGAHLGHWRGSGAEQLDRLLLAAVDRIDELHRFDAVVVAGPRLHKDLFQRAGGHVTSGPGEGKHRGLVVQHVDRVLGRGGHQPGARTLHLDAIEPVLLHHEGTGEGAVFVQRQLARQRVVTPEVGVWAGNRREGAQVDTRPAQHGDVAAFVDGPVRQSGVGRKVVHQLEPVHVGQNLHIDAVHLRLDARGTHEVLGDVVHAEEHDLELARVLRPDHGQGPEFAIRAGAQEEFRFSGLETQVARGNPLVRTARDGDVPRGDLDGVGVHLRRADGRREQHRGAMAQERRSGKEGDEDGETDPHHGGGPAKQPSPLDPVPGVYCARSRDGGLQELPYQRGRMRGVRGLGVRSRVDGAQDSGLERRLMLLQVERDLCVGRPPPERAHEKPEPRGEERHPRGDSDSGDHAGAEAGSLHAPGGNQERHQPDPEQHRQPAQRDPHPPSVAHLADGVEQFQSGALVESCRHLNTPFSCAAAAPSGSCYGWLAALRDR